MVSLQLFAALALIEVIACGNILFLSGIASPSHHLWNRVLLRGLARKGFNITMVSVDDDKNPQPNIHYIFMEATYDTLYSGNNSIDLLERSDESPVTAILGIYNFCEINCDGILKSKGLDIILNYPNDFKFEAVIYDFTCGPCMLPLLHKFNYPPLISVTAFNNPPYSHHLTGGHKNPTFVPHYTVKYPQLMNFPQRLFNSFLYAFDTIARQHFFIPKLDRKVREKFNFKDFPSLDELEKKTVLMLINSDNAIENPEPLQPNVIQVGGLQITKPKELPEKMLKFIEGGKRGTILMSLGTNIKSNMLGNERLTAIIKTFAELPDFNFVWKFESEPHELPLTPSKNVFIAKFLPQNDILAHPSVVAFISHSGLLSTQESMWYGKPQITMPFFCDQIRTSSKSVGLGVAVEVDFRTLNVDGFKNAILKVVEEKRFSQNMKKISKLFQDKPQRSLDLAIWWIEYVIRNPSAPMYQSPSLKLGWFATESYDVMLAVLVTFYTLFFALNKLLNCFKKCLRSTESQKHKRN